MIAAIKAVMSKLAIMYPCALTQLSSCSVSVRRRGTGAGLTGGFCSHSTHNTRPLEMGKPQDWQLPTDASMSAEGAATGPDGRSGWRGVRHSDGFLSAAVAPEERCGS